MRLGSAVGPTVPAAFWATEAVLDALAARDIAQVFRLIQRETRISQTHLGVATGLSQAQVSEIISGVRRVRSIDVLTRICGGLHMTTDARMTLLLGERGRETLVPRLREAEPSQYADVEAIYPSRSEFTSRMPPHILFAHATDIRAAGLSLNLICQQYADNELVHLIRNGGDLRLLFLDPAGEAIRQRELEEGHTAGHLGALTTLNLHGMLRLRDRLPAELHDRIEVATYDQTVRVNVTLVDDDLCIAQPYLPHARGLEAPTMVIRKRWPQNGLYSVFERTFNELWESGQPR